MADDALRTGVTFGRFEESQHFTPNRAPFDDDPTSPSPLVPNLVPPAGRRGTAAAGARSGKGMAIGPRHLSSRDRATSVRAQRAAVAMQRSVSVGDLLRGSRAQSATRQRRRVTMRSAALAVLMLVRIQRAVGEIRKKKAEEAAKATVKRQGQPSQWTRRRSSRRRSTAASRRSSVTSVDEDAAATDVSAANSAVVRLAESESDVSSDEDLPYAFDELRPPADVASEGRATAATSAPQKVRPGASSRVQHFPSYQATLGYPPEVREAVVRDASAILRKSCDRYAFRLRATERRRLRARLVPPDNEEFRDTLGSAVERSRFFAAWPMDAVVQLVREAGTWETLSHREPIAYFREPPTHAYWVYQGTVAVSSKRFERMRTFKRVTPGSSAVLGRSLEGSRFLRDVAGVADATDDSDGCGAIHVDSDAAIIVSIPVSAIRRAMANLQLTSAAAQKHVVDTLRAIRGDYVRRHFPVTKDWLKRTALFGSLAPEDERAVAGAFEPMSFLASSLVIDRSAAADAASRSPAKPERSKSGRPASHARSSASPTFQLTAADGTSEGAGAETDGLGDGQLRFDALVLVARGELRGSMPVFRNGAKESVVFTMWRRGEHFGEKAAYFQEKYIFSVHAAVDTDCFVLSRDRLLGLLHSQRNVRRVAAAGALAIRRGDPAVAMRLESVRGIPWIAEGVTQGLVSETVIRGIFALFEFRIFPQGELLTSASRRIDALLVVMTGTAITAYNTGEPAIVPLAKVLGTNASLRDMRWRYATIAATECEGWVLPCDRLREFLQEQVDTQQHDALVELIEGTYQAARKDVHAAGAQLTVRAADNPNVHIMGLMEKPAPIDDPPPAGVSRRHAPLHRFDNAAARRELRESSALSRGKLLRTTTDWDEIEVGEEARAAAVEARIRREMGEEAHAESGAGNDSMSRSTRRREAVLQKRREGPGDFNRRGAMAHSTTMPSFVANATASRRFTTTSQSMKTSQIFSRSRLLSDASHSDLADPSHRRALLYPVAAASQQGNRAGADEQLPQRERSVLTCWGPVALEVPDADDDAEPEGHPTPKPAGRLGRFFARLRDEEATATRRETEAAKAAMTADPDVELGQQMQPRPRTPAEAYQRMLAPAPATKLFGTKRAASAGARRKPPAPGGAPAELARPTSACGVGRLPAPRTYFGSRGAPCGSTSVVACLGSLKHSASDAASQSRLQSTPTSALQISAVQASGQAQRNPSATMSHPRRIPSSGSRQ